MKFCILLSLLPIITFSQISVNYDVNVEADTQQISPFIYGSNNGGFTQSTFRRQGGNRLTGYNWENGASNAGSDYFHQSDDYLIWTQGIPFANQQEPGIATTYFHDQSLLLQTESVVTLPLAGYVAKDKNNTSVSISETAPSNRWAQVINNKPTAFSLNPDLSDNFVYIDEWINFLLDRYGNAVSETGIKAFIMDNEPGVWSFTHPRIHPNPTTCVEHLNKSIALAKTIRGMDQTVEIWGPESYGYYEYLNLQDAPDWSTYSGQYSHYLAAYLDSMEQASQNFGNRLLDALTVHWYPDILAGAVYSSDISPSIAYQRMQVPRTLWDSTYHEASWIGQFYSQDLPILPKLNQLIDNYYPGTKLGITEYDYGADSHISGGIAQVEALMGFIITGTDYASKWGTFADYSLSAINLFRQLPTPFGDLRVLSNSSDRTLSNIVASKNNINDGILHLVVTNKDDDSTINATFNISSVLTYDSVTVYWFNSSGTQINSTTIATNLLNGVFNYNLSPLSAYHFVFKSSINVGDFSQDFLSMECFPNPSESEVNITWSIGITGKLTVCDLLGNEFMHFDLQPTQKEQLIPLQNMSTGTYFVTIETSKYRNTLRIIKR